MQGCFSKLCGSDWCSLGGSKKGYAQIKANRVNLSKVICLAWPGGVLQCTLNALWLKTGADSKLRQTSSRLKAIPLHSVSLVHSCWSQNKASQSNHEKRWVGRAGERKRWREAEKEPFSVYVHGREWVGERALQHQSCELRGPWLALRGVYVSKTQNHPVHCSHCLREKLWEMQAPAFSQPTLKPLLCFSIALCASSL